MNALPLFSLAFHTHTNVPYKGFYTITNMLGSVLFCSIKEGRDGWQGKLRSERALRSEKKWL